MSKGEVPVRRRRTTYTPEYKADAVAMVLDTGRTITEVARELGIGDRTFGVWMKQARIDGDGNGTSVMRSGLSRDRITRSSNRRYDAEL
ncbi:MAG: hypothetical protein EOO27_20735 [Comamonadaceae bacterium]|nr:MAG: hypothetical protein EOO27_20735 [Comamonadaceae bacterium]